MASKGLVPSVPRSHVFDEMGRPLVMPYYCRVLSGPAKAASGYGAGIVVHLVPGTHSWASACCHSRPGRTSAAGFVDPGAGSRMRVCRACASTFRRIWTRGLVSDLLCVPMTLEWPDPVECQAVAPGAQGGDLGKHWPVAMPWPRPAADPAPADDPLVHG